MNDVDGKTTATRREGQVKQLQCIFHIVTGRIAAKWQTESIEFTRRLKISIFTLPGQLVH